jgi:glycosyltransferase involved in cell wall biosynthesis
MRIAFITNEFTTEKSTAGGLGTYLNRVTQLLRDRGHTPEVFVPSDTASETVEINGVWVHRVGIMTADGFVSRAVNWLLVRLFRELWSGPAGYLNTAWHLSRAFHAREKQVDFDLVQSTNCGCSGLLIQKRAGRPHVMRLSSKRDLWFECDGKKGPGFSAMSFLEKLSAGRADAVYAPSRFIARECTQKWHVTTGLLRPPVFIETQPAYVVSCDLPDRFMIHFGTFAPRKGSLVLARALKRVWEQAPDFTMLWCGSFVDSETRNACVSLFGPHASKIHLPGALEKAELYAVIKKSMASILPSLADNFPNTVIESLLLGIPVIGTYGSSIDELIQDRITGLLVEKASEQALADAILSVWNKNIVFDTGGLQKNALALSAESGDAVERLVHAQFSSIDEGS